MFSGPQKRIFVDLSCNNTLKSKMDRFCTNFWYEARAEYPDILKAVLCVFIFFATSYMCKAGFSAVTVLKQHLARN